MTPLQPDTFAALRDKYDALLDLRRARDDAEGDGRSEFTPAAALERRQLMRDVALRFPGALRELEVLDRAALDARREAIEAVMNGAESPQWMRAVALLHPALRTTLAERLQISMLQRKALPRPSVRAFQLVADSLGTTPAEAERLVFPRR